MKKRWIGIALALCMVLTLLPFTALAAMAAMAPVESSNVLRRDFPYPTTDSRISSYLYDTGSALARVEYTNERLLLETYTYDGKLLTQRTLPEETGFSTWSYFGGVFIGAEHNYAVYAAMNDAGNDEGEVFRIVKYSKAWQRLGSVSVFGENTTNPMFFGSLRMAEDENLLYIHTSHQMYNAHQANMTFAVNKAEMRVTDVRSGVYSESVGYVSHSDGQFAVVDNHNRLVALDVGDGYPRAVTLFQYQPADENGVFLPTSGRDGKRVSLRKVEGTIGNGVHCLNIGGLRATQSHYIAVGVSLEPSVPSGTYTQRNVFVHTVPQDNLSEDAVRTIWLTNYPWDASEPQYVSVPKLAALRDGRSIVLWMMGDTVYYQYLDQKGNPVGAVRSGKGALSDCVPVQIGDSVLWYVTEGSGPTFYRIDANGVLSSFGRDNPFRDVAENQYFYGAVIWAMNHVPQVTAGTSATTFSPNNPCTRGQMVTFLWRAMGCPEPTITKNPFRDVKASDYFYKAVLWAVEKGITAGTSKTTFSPAATVTRAQTVTFLWRAEGKPAVDIATPFTDVPAGQYYAPAALWAYHRGITEGTKVTNYYSMYPLDPTPYMTFSPADPCTRAQIVTFLYRDLAKK